MSLAYTLAWKNTAVRCCARRVLGDLKIAALDDVIVRRLTEGLFVEAGADPFARRSLDGVAAPHLPELDGAYGHNSLKEC